MPVCRASSPIRPPSFASEFLADQSLPSSVYHSLIKCYPNLQLLLALLFPDRLFYSEHLTRFHSRAPPAISVIEYLKRIVKYTNIEVRQLFLLQSDSLSDRIFLHQPFCINQKSPLLLLLPYLDAFCIQLPTFTLSSLTVHRFLITSACIASKALCDQFCTNQHYAKVGGIRVAELNLLERELIAGLGWRLVTEEALLQSYYASLITSYAAHQGHSSAASGETPRVVYVQGAPPPPAPPPPPPSYLPWPSIECFEAGTFSGESSAEQT